MEKDSIVEKIREGHKTILEDIYTAYRQEFISWLHFKYNCSLEDARDIYQYAVLEFYENVLNNKLNQLSSSVKTYLFAIGKNKALELYKKDMKLQLFDQTKHDQVDKMALTDGQNDAHMQHMEKCLEELGDPCKTVLELFYYYKRTMEDIMQQLDYKNADTVKTLKYKCIKRLRKLFFQTQNIGNNGNR
ncbi:MAG: RNA polymerase sigma factor [Candidatus Cyclobacteriaceae bacterium M3_2C_046]